MVSLNWVMDSENLYCAVVENKPQHEMETAISTVVEELKDIGIVGPKIERGQIHFKIAQIKNNTGFRKKHPEALVPLITQSVQRVIPDIKTYYSIPESIADKDISYLASDLQDIKHVEKVTYEEGSYKIKFISIFEKVTMGEPLPREEIIDTITLSDATVNRLVKKFFS